MRISDWSSDVCSSDLDEIGGKPQRLKLGDGRIVGQNADAPPRSADRVEQPLNARKARLHQQRQRPPVHPVVDKGGNLEFGKAGDGGDGTGKLRLERGCSVIGQFLAQPPICAKRAGRRKAEAATAIRSEEHTSELRSLMRNS